MLELLNEIMLAVRDLSWWKVGWFGDSDAFIEEYFPSFIAK